MNSFFLWRVVLNVDENIFEEGIELNHTRRFPKRPASNQKVFSACSEKRPNVIRQEFFPGVSSTTGLAKKGQFRESPTVATITKLQNGVGNRAVGRLINGTVKKSPPKNNGRGGKRSSIGSLRKKTTPTVQMYRDFNGASGTPQYDYKIVDGIDQTFGKYHIKFHNLDQMGVYDEVHIVFEQYDRRGYFFYSDQGIIDRAKSSGLNLGVGGLTERAQELIDLHLRTSSTVDDTVVDEMRAEKRERERRRKEQEEIWAREREEQERSQREGKIKGEMDRLVRAYDSADRLNQRGLLKPIIETGVAFVGFTRFGVLDPLDRWPPPLADHAVEILEAIHDFNLDTLVSGARGLNRQQRFYLAQLFARNRRVESESLPPELFDRGENPTLAYDREDGEYDIYYDAQEGNL